MQSKKWYLSKIIWVNVVASLAIILQMQYNYILPAEVQALCITVINLVLRKVTNQELE